ncbi:hypothetical protein TNCV_2509101 [Trichonephila clavipes]|nr:hypothetical protein TNCV_2509101 [Trichonephila clavipes]
MHYTLPPPKNKELKNSNTVDAKTSDSDFEESESDTDDEDNDNVIVEDIANEDEILNHQELLPTINKVQKIIKIFKRSPTKNAILQEYMLTENKTEHTVTQKTDVDIFGSDKVDNHAKGAEIPLNFRITLPLPMLMQERDNSPPIHLRCTSFQILTVTA